MEYRVIETDSAHKLENIFNTLAKTGWIAQGAPVVICAPAIMQLLYRPECESARSRSHAICCESVKSGSVQYSSGDNQIWCGDCHTQWLPVVKVKA